jgi:hypothetical protein
MTILLQILIRDDWTIPKFVCIFGDTLRAAFNGAQLLLAVVSQRLDDPRICVHDPARRSLPFNARL